ncbi:MAG: DEAD/DEAH box helicase [Planctomycetales bacterium]|nr:DEAD/DEAH box helicase [Planctomycetales bacterium]
MSSSVVESNNSFQQFSLSEPLRAAVADSGYVTPTPIQARTIPVLLAGRDVVGQAQTGTGKTAAFALPILDRIDPDVRATQVLVLAPTRELAIQVAEAFERYSANLDHVHVAAIYGGQDYQVQFRRLERGAQVVVGTPGRVMDHMRRGSLRLDALRALVLDEADEMLRMGFADDVDWVLSHTPAERQTALFSATMPEPIRRIAQQHLRDPESITIEQTAATADTIRQRYVVSAPHQKESLLLRILEAESTDGVLIFVKTRATTEPLADFLNRHGLRSDALHGEIAQNQRERILQRMRSGELDVIVATDVAARGLDVDRISHVINYDLPFDSEAYVHRIGRTGRAGRSGEAILFVHPRDKRHLLRLERETRQRIEPMETPSNRAINKRRVARFHEQVTEALTHCDLATMNSIVEQYRRQHEDVSLEEVAAALAVLAVGDQPILLKDELRPQTFYERSDTSGRGQGDRKRRDQPREGRPSKFGQATDGNRSRKPRRESGMETYRIDVGRVHRVGPGNIVGAITNEAGIDSDMIGRIEIFDNFSTVDMAAGMPPAIFQALRQARVAGRPMNFSRAATDGGRGEVTNGRERRPRSGAPAKRRPKMASR